jgi:integrase/recombinase XerD
MFRADDLRTLDPGETWRWQPITVEEAGIASTSAPADGNRDERWLALKLLARKKNLDTRDGYRRDLNTLLTWWSAAILGRRPLHARKTDLEDYVAHLADLEIAPATQLRRLAVASAFYELAIDEELRDTTPMRGVERPKAANENVRLGLGRASAERLLKHAETWDDPREGALTVLLLLRGLRISEALSARARDIAAHDGRLAIEIIRKGSTARTTVLVDDDWLIQRLLALKDESDADDPLFGDMSRFDAVRALRRLGEGAGIEPPPHPHLLRHTFVSQLLAAGKPVREVQKLAGHASIATTQRYADALDELTSDVSPILRKRFGHSAA